MESKPKILGLGNRRDFLATLFAFSASPALSKNATAVHLDAAQKARKLAAGKDLTLNLLVPFGTGNSIDVVTDKFCKLTGIKVKKTESSIDQINADLTLDHISQSNRYDIALPATFGIMELVQSNAIRSVKEFKSRHKMEGDMGTIGSNSSSFFGLSEYGYQADGDAYLMFYNNDMLHNSEDRKTYQDRYGENLEAAKTWSELDRQMAFFHRPDEDQAGGLLFRTPDYAVWEWWMRFHAKGYWPLASDLTPQIHQDAGVSVIEDMIRSSENLDPDTANLDIFQNWSRFSEGQTYCNLGWGGSQKFFQSKTSSVRGKLSYATAPGGVIDGDVIRTPYFNWGWTWVVTTSSTVPEIAFLFNQFISSPEMSTLAIQQTDGFFDPFRAEHYSDKTIQQTYSPAFLDVHRDSMEGAIPDLYLFRQGEYFRTLANWLHAALTHDVTPQRALLAAAQKWEAITASVGHEQQERRWARLRESYPLNVRSKLRDFS